MAVTVTATKIDITSGTYTLDELYTAVVDLEAAAMTKTGADPYVYSVIGNREVEISSGCVLNISNDGDTLQWTLTASKSPVLDVAAGGTFTMTTNTTLDGGTAAGANSRTYIYGYTSLQGTSGNEVTIKNFYENRFYHTTVGQTSHDWDYVIIELESLYSTTSYGLAFYHDTLDRPTHTFDNVTMKSTNSRGYGIMAYPGDWSGITFDNIIMDGVRYGIQAYGVCLKFTNSTFKNMSYHSYIRGSGVTPWVRTSKDTTTNPFKTTVFQPKWTFDTCTFQDNYELSATERGFYLSYGALIKFKDCTFAGVDDAMSYGAYANYLSKFVYEGTTTFTNVTTNRRWATNGTHYHAHPLALTVKDQNGNAIENADVTVTQSEGYEHWYFRTDSSGNVYDIYDDDPVFIEKEETSTGVYDNWSTSIASGLYHTITVSKDGYQVWQRKITFTGDQTVTATMVPAPSHRILPVSF